MKMKKLSDIFKIEYPKTMIFSNMFLDDSGINYVSSKGKNNNVVAKVQKNLDYKEYPANTITVPLKGTVLWACLQTEPCYVAHQVAVLISKIDLTIQQLAYYCLCIRHNKYRYNYGRQADKSLKDLLIPDITEIPSWVEKTKVPTYEKINAKILSYNMSLFNDEWKFFNYEDLFNIKRGTGPRKQDLTPGETPFVTSTCINNGISAYTNYIPTHNGNTITVNRNGSVAEAFYQETPFCSTEDVHIFNPKFEMNKYIAMFLITLIKKERYRYSYGRKWGIERMKQSKIKLPVNENGSPNWEYIENYIKSLPFSASI